MPRPRPPSPVPITRVPISVRDNKRLSRFLGLEQLPAKCADAIGEVLACALKIRRTEKSRTSKTTAGNVESAIAIAARELELLVALDSGLDDESRTHLKPAVDAFAAAAHQRVAELRKMERVLPHQEILRSAGPFLRVIFERYANPDFRKLSNLRRFAYHALKSAELATGIDESHLDRLDNFLNAEPLPV
jgi:hypothetical protein